MNKDHKDHFKVAAKHSFVFRVFKLGQYQGKNIKHISLSHKLKLLMRLELCTSIMICVFFSMALSNINRLKIPLLQANILF